MKGEGREGGRLRAMTTGCKRALLSQGISFFENELWRSTLNHTSTCLPENPY